jgi:hypothetical protein
MGSNFVVVLLQTNPSGQICIMFVDVMLTELQLYPLGHRLVTVPAVSGQYSPGRHWVHPMAPCMLDIYPAGHLTGSNVLFWGQK